MGRCIRKHSGILRLRFRGRSRAISRGRGHLAACCVLRDSNNGEIVADVVLENFKERLSGPQPPSLVNVFFTFANLIRQ